MPHFETAVGWLFRKEKHFVNQKCEAKRAVEGGKLESLWVPTKGNQFRAITTRCWDNAALLFWKASSYS